MEFSLVLVYALFPNRSTLEMYIHLTGIMLTDYHGRVLTVYMYDCTQEVLAL
jgi:hypothetical protein